MQITVMSQPRGDYTRASSVVSHRHKAFRSVMPHIPHTQHSTTASVALGVLCLTYHIPSYPALHDSFCRPRSAMPHTTYPHTQHSMTASVASRLCHLVMLITRDGHTGQSTFYSPTLDYQSVFHIRLDIL